MSLRALARGSILYTFGTFLPRLGAFLLLPIYTMTLDPADFGVVSLMLSVSSLLAIAYRLGLDGALLRLHFDLNDRNRPRLYVSLAAVTAATAVVSSIVLGLVVAPFFGALFTGIGFVPFGLLTLAITATTSLQYVPTVLYRATERPGMFLAYSSGVMLVGIVATVVFLVPMHLGAAGALLGQLAGGAFGVVVTAWVIGRLRPIGIDRAMIRAGLAFGLPLVPHGISGWILNVSDRWLLGLLLAMSALQAQAAIGVYSLGYQLGQVVSLIALSFNAAWGPFFYAHGESESGPGILREMTTVVAGLLGLLAVALALGAPELTHLVAPARWGAARTEAADVLRVVAGGSFVYSLYFMVVSAVFLTRRTTLLPLLTITAGATNVILNLVLIPRVGVMGAAWSTLVGYLVLAVGTALYARRGYPLRVDLARIAALAAVGAALVVAARVALPVTPSLGAFGLHVVAILAFAGLTGLVLRRPVQRLRVLVRRASAAAPGSAHAVLG